VTSQVFNIEPFAGTGGVMESLTMTEIGLYLGGVTLLLISVIILKLLLSNKGEIQLTKSKVFIKWEK